MKKIIIGVLLFFNFGITISNHQITVNVGNKMYAQHQGDIRCPYDPGGGYSGTNSNWWDIFTGWIHDVVQDAIQWLGELFSPGNSGYETYYNTNLYYYWGSGETISNIEVYYEGDNNYACLYTPSIFGGPYRGGRMWNCNNEPPIYEDCAFASHNCDPAGGISGTTADIAYLDECNQCVGGITGLPPCSSPLYYTRLENGDTTKHYNGDTISIEVTTGINWPNISLYNEHGVPPASIAWTATCNSYILNGWFGASSTGILNTTNVGNYTITVDEGNLLSHSTIFTNFLNVVKTDTAKPTPVICDSVDIINGQKLTNTYDSIKNLPDFKRVQDTALVSSNEAGVSVIRNTNGTLGTFNFQTGGTGSVTVLQFDATHNIFTGNHAHTTGPTRQGAISPSPGDLYHLIEGYLVNPNYLFEYESAHDSSVWAIMINNTDTASLFNTQHPEDSTLQNPAMDDWDSTRVLPNTGISLYNHNLRFQAYLNQTQHYPLEYIKAYADVIMYDWFFNTGVSMFVRQNGQFKKLGYDAFLDASNNAQIIITICQ